MRRFPFVDQNTQIAKPFIKRKSESWWVGTTREEFNQRLAQRRIEQETPSEGALQQQVGIPLRTKLNQR